MLTGTTHEEAELFCKTVGNMHLCPVAAYCPNGPRSAKPLFLHKNLFPGEQWAPVSEYNNGDEGIGNDWVMIGNSLSNGSPTADSPCALYETLNGDMSPPWTADGSHTELKQHVLCCMPQEKFKHEQDIIRGMNPIWLDKSHGWTGGSYEDGEKFCKGLDKKLCPYTACECALCINVIAVRYTFGKMLTILHFSLRLDCPHGPGTHAMGGHASDFNLEGEQWAPVYGENNHWVLIGRKYGNSATTCYSHDQLEGVPPEWGLTRGKPESKLHIQCCSF